MKGSSKEGGVGRNRGMGEILRRQSAGKKEEGGAKRIEYYY